MKECLRDASLRIYRLTNVARNKVLGNETEYIPGLIIYYYMSNLLTIFDLKVIEKSNLLKIYS